MKLKSLILLRMPLQLWVVSGTLAAALVHLKNANVIVPSIRRFSDCLHLLALSQHCYFGSHGARPIERRCVVFVERKLNPHTHRHTHEMRIVSSHNRDS